MRRAAYIVRNDIQSPTTKIKPKESSSAKISSSRNTDRTLRLPANENPSNDQWINQPKLLRKTPLHNDRVPKHRSPTTTNFPSTREVSKRKISVATLCNLFVNVEVFVNNLLFFF